VTGCGCLVVIAAIVALLVLFIRGSFDSGEPVAQALALGAVALALQRWGGKRTADQLVRARSA
jgi:hypothetical protein